MKAECKGAIISWKFGEDLDLLIVKSTDGLQYFGHNLSDLSSLPKREINHLAQLNLINRSNNDWEKHIELVLRKDVRERKFDLLKPSVGKRVIYKKKIDPVKKKPWVKLVYPPIKSLKKIPLNKYPLDLLKNFIWWWYNGVTGEAVLENKEEGEKLHIYDPISLINLSASDLEILHKNKILYDNECRAYAMNFQRVADMCVNKGIHKELQTCV